MVHEGSRSWFDKPVLSEVEGPVLSEVEGPVLSEVEGLTTNGNLSKGQVNLKSQILSSAVTAADRT